MPLTHEDYTGTELTSQLLVERFDYAADLRRSKKLFCFITEYGWTYTWRPSKPTTAFYSAA